MFKQITTIFILMCLLVQTFNRAIVVSSYYVNTNSYVKNCINKAKPKLHCNGKCQMMKKLKEEEKKDSDNTTKKSYQDEVLSSKSFYSSISIHSFSTKSFQTPINTGFPIDQSSVFFHPPCA
jgi:hypothetical protein